MEISLEIFRQAIIRLYPKCNEEEWRYLVSGLDVLVFKPKAFFIEAGEKEHHLGFITSGLVRGYYINEEGEEITILFAKENEYVTDYASLITREPSKYYFQCLEPTTIVTLSYQHMQDGYELYSGFERYGRLVAEEVFKTLQERIESFQFNQAEQRYLNFLSKNKELFNRISLTHLSSFLGIERPSLSRIRKKITGR